MRGKTKLNISENIISEIFNRHNLGKVTSIKVMTGGNFNTVLKVKTSNNLYAIKIATKDDTQVLTYEHQLIKSEVYIYKLLEQVKGIKFPKIYGYNWENNYPYKYLIMEFIDGDMMSKVKLSQADYKMTADSDIFKTDLKSLGKTRILIWSKILSKTDYPNRQKFLI